MAKMQIDFSEMGGEPLKRVTGTFTTINGTKTVTIPELSKIKILYLPELWSDNRSSKYYDEESGVLDYSSLYGLQSVTNNSFDFKWVYSATYPYIAYGN